MNEPPVNPFLAIRLRSLLLWVFVTLTVSTVLLQVIAASLGYPDDPRVLSLTILLMYPLALWWLYRKLRRYGIPLTAFVPHTELSIRRVVLYTVLLIAAATGGVWLLYQPLSLLFPDWVESRMRSMDWVIRAPGEPYAIVTNAMNLLTIVVIAPIAEELLFRGFLLHRFAAKWNLTTGVVLSSLAFSLLHVDLVGKMIFGILLSLLYLRTRSLAEPIAIHMLNNLFAMLSGMAMVFHPESRMTTVMNTLSEGWVPIALLIVSVPLAVHELRKHWPGPDTTLPLAPVSLPPAPALP